MYGLSNEEKLEFILQKSKELGITPNDYGAHTKLSTMGAYNILKGKSKNPHTKNLNSMLLYLESKQPGRPYKENEDIISQAAEAAAEKLSLEDVIYEKVYQRLQPEISALNKKITTLREDLKRVHDNQMDILKNNSEAKKSSKAS